MQNRHGGVNRDKFEGESGVRKNRLKTNQEATDLPNAYIRCPNDTLKAYSKEHFLF